MGRRASRTEGRLVDADVLEIRRVVRSWSVMRLGSRPESVSVSPSWVAGQRSVWFRVGEVWYRAFAERFPVGPDDSYLDVHVCWRRPCPSCGF